MLLLLLTVTTTAAIFHRATLAPSRNTVIVHVDLELHHRELDIGNNSRDDCDDNDDVDRQAEVWAVEDKDHERNMYRS